MSVTSYMPGTPRLGTATRDSRLRSLAKLGDVQPVGLRAILDRFLAALERLGDRLERHALLGQRVELLELVARPGLPMPLETLRSHELPLRFALFTPSCPIEARADEDQSFQRA